MVAAREAADGAREIRGGDLPQPGLHHVPQGAGHDPRAGVEPRVIEYLKTPPSRAELVDLLRRMGLTPRATAAPARHAVRRTRPG